MKKFTKLINLNLLTILLLVILVSVLQYSLLNQQLKWGFSPDDFWPLFDFKTLPSQPTAAFKQLWAANGIYTSYQVIYIGILERFFDSNFLSYQITNQLFKFLSTLSLYPLTYIIFKRRLLAVLVTVLYAISYPPVGTLELVVRGSDFLSIAFMSLFGITCYQLIFHHLAGWRWLTTASFLLVVCLLLSPIRMYPLLVLITVVELYLILTRFSRNQLTQSAKRLAYLFAPFLLALIISPNSFLRFLSGQPLNIYHYIGVGNWQMLLSPFASLGSIFLPDWQFLGRNIQVASLSDYLSFLVQGPLLIFSLMAVLFAVIVSAKPISLILRIISLNIVLEVIAYFLLTHQYSIAKDLQTNYDVGNLHPILGGIFLFSLAIASFSDWRKNSRNRLLTATVWFGLLFSFIYIVTTWIMVDFIVVFKGVHTYLTVSAVGIALAQAGLITLTFDRLRTTNPNLRKTALASLVLLILIPIYITSHEAIKQFLDSFSKNGAIASEQQALRDNIWNNLVKSGYNDKELNLVYLDTQGDYPNGRFYEISVLGRFDKWMFLTGSKKTDRCLAPRFVIEQKAQLAKLVTIKANKAGILFTDTCGRETFYDLNHFYAIKLYNRQAINIKQSLAQEIGLN